MRQLNDQEVEALQSTIIDEGYLPTSEKFGFNYYRSTYEIDGVGYLMVKSAHRFEVFEIE